MRKQVIVSVVLGIVVFCGATPVVWADLPDPGMKVVAGRTALVITDPQNDFLSPDGVTWGVVGESVTANKTVENLGKLFEAAKSSDMPVFVSPHYYYPTDHGWQFKGALEVLMHNIGMFDRKGTNDLVLQLRKRGIDKIILAGMSANLCTESHMRELLEQGFEVAVVKDATAAAIVPEGNGYEAAVVNFRFIANAVWTTEEAVKVIKAK